MLIIGEKEIFNIELLDKLSHNVEEQQQTIDELQKENKRLLEVLNRSDAERFKLIAENTSLKKENYALKRRVNMMTKNYLNGIFGLGITHWLYTDTDSIKTESEDDKHDDNN